MSPFDYFDEIYCINLERRSDRWSQCQSEFEKVGILDKVIRFDAVDNRENTKRGCYESHMGVIKLAHERKLKNVLIFEDDVAFLKRYDDRKLNRAIESLNETDWEFFYLGGLERRMKPRPTYNRLSKKWDGVYNADYDYIMECRSVGWAHSFAVNSTMFERVVSDYDNNIWDVLVEKHDSHLDRYYQEVLQPKTYACVPTLTTQYNSVSDLSRTRKNKSLRLDPKDNNESNPFDFFDEIYCINLDHRTDRWEAVQSEFDKLGIAERVKRISAVNREDIKQKHGDLVSGLSNPKLGQLAVTESSRKCIDDAIECEAKNCLTFQDDVCFHNYDEDFFREALSELPDDWECMFLGYECWRRTQTHQKYSDKLLHIEKFWMAQAVANNGISFHKFYENWMDIINPPPRKIREGSHEELLWDYNNYGLTYEHRFAFQVDNENDSDINDGKVL